MNDLRLVLLAAGVIALLILWLLDARRERFARRQHTILRHGRGSEIRISRDDEPEPEYAELPPMSPRAGPAPAQEPPAAPEFVAIFVQAPAQAPFPQARVFECAEAAGLVWDTQGIFTMPGASAGSVPLFTVANLHEPGTFSRDPDTRPTRGLALIMRLPPPVDGPVALDLMLHMGELLARDLAGALVDAAHRPLDAQGVAALRRAIGAQGDQ